MWRCGVLLTWILGSALGVPSGAVWFARLRLWFWDGCPCQDPRQTADGEVRGIGKKSATNPYNKVNRLFGTRFRWSGSDRGAVRAVLSTECIEAQELGRSSARSNVARIGPVWARRVQDKPCTRHWGRWIPHSAIDSGTTFLGRVLAVCRGWLYRRHWADSIDRRLTVQADQAGMIQGGGSDEHGHLSAVQARCGTVVLGLGSIPGTIPGIAGAGAMAAPACDARCAEVGFTVGRSFMGSMAEALGGNLVGPEPVDGRGFGVGDVGGVDQVVGGPGLGGV